MMKRDTDGKLQKWRRKHLVCFECKVSLTSAKNTNLLKGERPTLRSLYITIFYCAIFLLFEFTLSLFKAYSSYQFQNVKVFFFN
jgi:hypothetical protein